MWLVKRFEVGELLVRDYTFSSSFVMARLADNVRSPRHAPQSAPMNFNNANKPLIA